MLECQNQVAEHHQRLDLLFLDEEEYEEEPSDRVTAPNVLVEIAPILASQATLAKAITDPVTIKTIAAQPPTMAKAAPSNLVTMDEPPTITNLKEVGN